MKESTKYNEYRFVGKISIDEIMPWFDFGKGKPWDEGEVPWVLENKVRRQILINLAKTNPKSLDEIVESVNFSPSPLLIDSKEYIPQINYQWNKSTVENHLLNLEWYNLIRKNNNKYEPTFPILSTEHVADLEKYTVIFAEEWIKIITQMKDVLKNLSNKMETTLIFEILIEKTIERLYSLLKKERLLPNEPNLKALWAEQLRSVKFEEWLDNNF